MPSTKIDLNSNKIARLRDLDELAQLLFPRNRTHQKLFLAVYVKLKWSETGLLPTLEPIAREYAMSRRTLETVRAKMRRMGLIDHVSRFNQRYGYREGWVFSTRFAHSTRRLGALFEEHRKRKEPRQEAKDRDLLNYL